MSMPDLARFLREHLRALRGEPALLPPAIAREMHTRRSGGGLGFGVGKVKEIEPASTYSGSAGTLKALPRGSRVLRKSIIGQSSLPSPPKPNPASRLPIVT